MTTAFKRNPRYESELRKDPKYRDGLALVAEPALVAIKAATPKGHHTGRHAADSLTIVKTDSQVAITSSDPFWHLIEFGSVHNPAYAPMRRGIRSLGWRLDLSSI